MTDEKLSERMNIVWDTDGYRDIITWIKEVEALEDEVKRLDSLNLEYVKQTIQLSKEIFGLKTRLVKAQELPEKWRNEGVDGGGWATDMDIFLCADELEKVLGASE